MVRFTSVPGSTGVPAAIAWREYPACGDAIARERAHLSDLEPRVGEPFWAKPLVSPSTSGTFTFPRPAGWPGDRLFSLEDVEPAGSWHQDPEAWTLPSVPREQDRGQRDQQPGQASPASVRAPGLAGVSASCS